MELREILTRVKELNGSDVHLAAGLPVAVRVNDELVVLRDLGRPTTDQMRDMIYPILAQEEIARFESDPKLRHELDFARGIAELGRFRFNLHRQRGSLAATIRLLPATVPTLEALGLPPVVREFSRGRRGLVLVTGPSGSGRSSTLASLVDEVNRDRSVRILTIEDPVEFIIPSNRAYVTQREVGDGADTLSFENALRYARRQDLDVVMVSNLPGFETMRRVLELCEMGRLVLASMTTTSAIQTLRRFIECFPAEQKAQALSQLSANLLGIVTQILLPRNDHKGRVPACEIMKVNTLVRTDINQDRFDALVNVMQQSTSEGMQTMDQALLDLARQNLIDYATARPHIRDDATHRMIYQIAGKDRAGSPLPPGMRRTPPPAEPPKTPSP
jgi:twitching motility protein PilT